MNNKEFQIIELEKKESKEEEEKEEKKQEKEEKEEKKQENKPQKETKQSKRPAMKKLFKECVWSLTRSLSKRVYDNTSDFIFLFERLSVFVKERPILRNVSLTLPKSNQIIVIAGASGCGKTTLLNVINNYDLPAPYVLSGKLNYHHSNIKMIGHKSIFNPYLTVKETVQMFINSYRYTHSVDYYLERFRLIDIKDKYIGNDENKSLSTGQLVQLSILLNTMETPDLLILDEPLSNLDIKTSIHIMKLLKELNIPIILTLHHPNNIILESVDQLIVMEEGEIVLNTSLIEISNRLEYYEQQVLGIKKKQDENITTLTDMVSLEIIDYKNYISTVYFSTKIYNVFYNILKYNLRNNSYHYSILFSYVPLIVSYILLKGTDFQDSVNGYFYLINNVYSITVSLISVVAVNLFEYEKLIHFIKYFGNINILNYKFFYIIYSCLNWLTTTTIFILVNAFVISYLSPNNSKIFYHILYVLLFSKFFETLTYSSFIYIFEKINITSSFFGIFVMFQSITSGQSTKQYPELKNYSLFYHLMNILSVKAQEVYNYPLLPNGEPIYTLYGYSKDISNSYYYVFGFFIIPFLIYTCYTKKMKMFLT